MVSDRKTQRYLCFDSQNTLCGWTNIATGELKGRDGRHLAFSGMQILSPDALALLPQMPAEKFSLIDFYLSLCTGKLSPLTKNEVNRALVAENHHSPLLQAYVPTDYRMMDVGKIDQIAQAEAFAANL